MKRPEFTHEQEEWLVNYVDDWYRKINHAHNRYPQRLNLYTDMLKVQLKGENSQAQREDK